MGGGDRRQQPAVGGRERVLGASRSGRQQQSCCPRRRRDQPAPRAPNGATKRRARSSLDNSMYRPNGTPTSRGPQNRLEPPTAVHCTSRGGGQSPRTKGMVFNTLPPRSGLARAWAADVARGWAPCAPRRSRLALVLVPAAPASGVGAATCCRRGADLYSPRRRRSTAGPPPAAAPPPRCPPPTCPSRRCGSASCSSRTRLPPTPPTHRLAAPPVHFPLPGFPHAPSLVAAPREWRPLRAAPGRRGPA